MFIVLFIALTTYAAMVFFVKFRTPIALLGSAILLIYGTGSHVFPADIALQRFPIEVVILIFVLALFNKVFERTGLLDYIGLQFACISKGNKIFIAALLPMILYATSLLMNNMSIMLIFTFISLELAISCNLPIVPLLGSAVIASNIGGVPLPWGDTPGMIITLYTDFKLIDFLTKLFLPCTLYAILLAGYTVIWFKYTEANHRIDETNKSAKITSSDFGKKYHHLHAIQHHFILISHHFHKLEDESNELQDGSTPVITSPPPPPRLPHELKHEEIKFPALLFVLFIAAIGIGSFIDVSIGLIAMVFGAVLLLVDRHNPKNTINTLPILDSIAFIGALFLINSALEYSGALEKIIDYIFAFTEENKFLILLSIMSLGFVITTFLSSGPAAVTLLPICLEMSSSVGNELVYAALAFGILAGSSMFPWSSTGGLLMMEEINRFIKQPHVSEESVKSISQVFYLKKYVAFSIPFSLIILLLSGIFLDIYLRMF